MSTVMSTVTSADASPSPAPAHLDLTGARRIAYHRQDASGDGAGRPGVVFLGGFRSDMTGTKAQRLDDWARAAGRAFLRFDYTGHGQSSGAFEDGAVGDWADDAFETIEALTEGPQILVGSSMGGWIALLIARRWLAAGKAPRLAGLVGIAAAPDFTEDMMASRFSDAQKEALALTGRLETPSDYGDPLVITARLIENGRENLVLRGPLSLPCPVRLLQGTADADVDTSIALQLLAHIDCDDARLTLVKDADHRMSEERELALLVQTVESL